MKTSDLVLLASILTASGCVGLNSMIFATKTEFAVDLDARPPTLNIGFSRQEAVLAPEFKNGEVHPVMTTIGASAGAFNLVSDQSFATGDAAIVMADSFTSDKPYFEHKQLLTLDANGKATTKVGVITTTASTNSEDFFGALWYLVAGNDDRKRYFFGTDSVLGLNVEWSGASVPTAVTIGWKRKELAYIPLMETPVAGGDQVEIRIPSLLATASAGVDIDGAPRDAELRVRQTYATGLAATLLSGHPGIRKVLGSALVTDAKLVREKAAQDQADARKLQEGFIKEIANAFGAGDAAKKKAIFDKAIEQKLIPDTSTQNEFRSKLALAADGTSDHSVELEKLAAFAKQ